MPTNKKQVQQFLGMASYYRRFIKDFAKIAKPLHRLTEHNHKFQWLPDCQRTFLQLRQQLLSPPILAHPDFSKQFILDTDASDSGLGAVLSQIGEDGTEKVIAYGSQLLSKPERKYCVARRELLAVVKFSRQYRPYLLGHKFVLRTDHGSLSWLQNFKEPEGQLARWLEQLQELNFEVVHRKGIKHNNADALSRIPCTQCGRQTHLPENHPALALPGPNLPTKESETIRALQLNDPTIGPLLRRKEEDQKPDPRELRSLGHSARRLLQIWNQLRVYNGILCRIYAPQTEGSQSPWVQMIIPPSLQGDTLRNLHEGTMAGHLGMEKMLARLQERFYWPGYHRDVTEWCQNCPLGKIQHQSLEHHCRV